MTGVSPTPAASETAAAMRRSRPVPTRWLVDRAMIQRTEWPILVTVSDRHDAHFHVSAITPGDSLPNPARHRYPNSCLVPQCSHVSQNIATPFSSSLCRRATVRSGRSDEQIRF